MRTKLHTATTPCRTARTARSATNVWHAAHRWDANYRKKVCLDLAVPEYPPNPHVRHAVVRCRL